jgi:GT2 family glycosyltransferase
MTAWGLLRMARFAGARHTLPRVSPDGQPWPASVTAVVPARDEAALIGSCVAALCASGPELLEVLVVDDASTDATAALASAAGDGRVRVVSAPGLHAGERGKPVGCATGAGLASGEWLWFVDADVEVAPDALRRLLACAEETRSSMVSAFGRVAADTPGTAWLLPEVGLTLARRLSLAAVADATSGAAFASGQCLLVRRTAYDALGGHGAVAGSVVEDQDLSALARARGVGQRLALAPDAFTVRMYADVGEAWQGLLKNSAAVRGTSAAATLREAAWAAAALAPVALVLSRRAPRGARRVAAMTVGAQVVTSLGGRLVGRAPLWPSVAAPAAEVALVAGWWASARKRRTGVSVGWRGRDVIVG